MPSRRSLQHYAIAISILSVFYNTAEGVVSIVFGAESSSRALVFYGLQSAVEVISTLLVTWRFLGVTKRSDESDTSSKTSSSRTFPHPKAPHLPLLPPLSSSFSPDRTSLYHLHDTTDPSPTHTHTYTHRIEWIATIAISLTAHDHPSTALPALLIAATATLLMAVFYLAKRYLARVLDSSTLHSEVLCARSCMQLSLVLFIGSLIDRVCNGGWWVDGTTAIAIGLLFGWEGVKMVRWTRNKNFDGGMLCRSSAQKQGRVQMYDTRNGSGESEQERTSC